jgi:hypothetical protein
MYIFSHGRGGVEWYISIDTSEKIMSIQIYKLNDIVIFEDKITIGSTSYVNYGDDNTCFKFSLSVDSYIFKSKDDIVNYFNYVVQILISIETLINCVKNLSQHIFNQTKIEIKNNTVFAEMKTQSTVFSDLMSALHSKKFVSEIRGTGLNSIFHIEYSDTSDYNTYTVYCKYYKLIESAYIINYNNHIKHISIEHTYIDIKDYNTLVYDINIENTHNYILQQNKNYALIITDKEMLLNPHIDASFALTHQDEKNNFRIAKYNTEVLSAHFN